MKRAEQLAWTAMGGLIVIALILLVGGCIFQFTAFWAGMLLAISQAVIAGLAAWGLKLAREVKELEASMAPAPESTGFQMSQGTESATFRESRSVPGEGELKTLDIGFQRLITIIAAAIMLILTFVSGYLVYRTYDWAARNPDKTLPIVGTLAAFDNDARIAAETPGTKIPVHTLDEMGLVIGLAAAGIYTLLWWMTRVKSDTEGEGEPVANCFTLGLTGMGALAVATLAGYLKYPYVSEIAAGIIAALMAVHGFELLVNAMRTYSSIEELDQEAVDLQAQPLIPMLGSVWLDGIKMLFAQSVGLSAKERRERGVLARIMPRALAAMILLAIVLSCVRVVDPGTVAVLERFGYAPFNDKTHELEESALLSPGLHFTLPWPIDQLVVIPTERLQETDVGTELHAPKNWSKVDFQFWTFRQEGSEGENEFVTGDLPAPQILETLVEVRWRVSNPRLFYSVLSHSDFFEKASESTKTLPIFQAIVQDCAYRAVTRAFAKHSLDQIMLTDRLNVESNCRSDLQSQLDELDFNGLKGCGIEIANLSIKDLHPPYFHTDIPNKAEQAIGPDFGQGNQFSRGPASAFEFVVSMQEWMQTQINIAEAQRIRSVNLAQGDADRVIAQANSYSYDHITNAEGDVGRFTEMTKNMPPAEKDFQLGLMKQQLLYTMLKKELLDPVTKVVVDPKVKNVEIYQTNDSGIPALRPPG